MTKFQDRLYNRINELEEILETNEQLESEKQNKKEQVKDVEMSSNAMLKKEERDESQDSDND